jgi:hypothetical protein
MKLHTVTGTVGLRVFSEVQWKRRLLEDRRSASLTKCPYLGLLPFPAPMARPTTLMQASATPALT